MVKQKPYDATNKKISVFFCIPWLIKLFFLNLLLLPKLAIRLYPLRLCNRPYVGSPVPSSNYRIVLIVFLFVLGRNKETILSYFVKEFDKILMRFLCCVDWCELSVGLPVINFCASVKLIISN